jgi:hypothetical protein
MSRWLSNTFLGVLFLALTATFADAAQTAVSSADLQRLDEAVVRLRADVDALGARDTALARSFDRELADLSEEVTYLKVKLRREGSVPRGDYTDLQGRITALERRVRADTTSSTTSNTPPVGANRTKRAGEIPVGQELDVRLQSSLSSNTAQVEDRFEATTLVDVLEGERVLIPAGSTMRGVVKAVESAGRINRRASLTLAFDQVKIKGRAYPIRATVAQVLESGGYREDAGKIGAGAAVGAIIGGILGGFEGAMAGILIGGGGTVVATEGKDVKLDVGTVLRVRFDEPLAFENGRSQ